jgi:chromosome segregation ATPase
VVIFEVFTILLKLILGMKVDMIKEEASKQQLQRELLEAELHQVRKQLEDTCRGDLKNQIIELKNNIEMLEKELSNKEAEVKLYSFSYINLDFFFKK